MAFVTCGIRRLRTWGRRTGALRLSTVGLLYLLLAGQTRAEDGYQLWLRYQPVAHPQNYDVRAIVHDPKTSTTNSAAAAELQHGLSRLLGRSIPVAATGGPGALVLGTPSTNPDIAALHLSLASLGREGYRIQSVRLHGSPATVIAANSDIGLLYGAFAFLRLVATEQPIGSIDLASAPKLQLRLLDHWDNLDGTIERGYAGGSLWKWQTLPGHIDPRYIDYARANASVGINGAVLNNVNSSSDILTPLYIEKVAALATAWRPYGVRVYLSPRFTAPMDLGKLKTADPLDPAVRAWWADEIAMIYRAVPDFGGFLIKASSEDQPGPQQYGRTHADAANMFADLLAPHGGVVMYRAFVYADHHGDTKGERVVSAFKDIKPLDGQFHANVIVQVKDGPFDFQPREPFHPLFGAMPRTPLMIEFPVTKEYMGQAADLAYLGVRYQEILQSDTFEHGPGSTVAKVLEGRLDHHTLTGAAGVANTGSDRNWTGSIFNQANWYAYGRFAWDPDASARIVADEWTRQTFGSDPHVVSVADDMLMRSYDDMVDYSTPLGLAFMMQGGTHFGPGMWDVSESRTDWQAGWFNKAAPDGVGFDRTRSGSDAVDQYNPPLSVLWADPKTTPDRYLLWFHHLPWSYRMKDGQTLWQNLSATYQRGVSGVDRMRAQWSSLEGLVDAERFAEISDYLAIQKRDAVWWRDAGMAYFESYSHRSYPDGLKPKYPLSYYKALPPGAAPQD
jgi:alpha-glucuronidase